MVTVVVIQSELFSMMILVATLKNRTKEFLILNLAVD